MTAGRPRRPETDHAIATATVAVLARVGYQALTIEAVAAEAGIGRPTIYRRYASKSELVAAALVGLADGDPSPGTTPEGPARGVLRGRLGRTAAVVGSPGGLTIMGSLLAEAHRDPGLLAIFRERVFARGIAEVRAVLERGQADGEVRAGADLDAAVDLAFGALLARSALGEPLDDRWQDALVDTLFRGIAATPETRT